MTLSQAIANYFSMPVMYEQEWVSVKCPLHSDSTASAGLNFRDKVFNCFTGCESRSFGKLAMDLGIEYDEQSEEIEQVNKQYNEWIDELIGQKKRPLVIRKQIEAFTNFLLERKIKPETIEEHGGYYESRENENDYGFLIIPYGIESQFIKRRIIGSGERFRNTDGVSKGLFGRDFVSSFPYILLEGITDYFTLWPYRKKVSINPIASLGAKVSKKQMYQLRNKRVFILFDGDYEGYEGARKAKEYLKEFNCIVNIIEFPERFTNDKTKTDVNSVYCEYGDVFIEWLSTEINKYNSYDNFYIRSVFNSSVHNNGTRLQQFSTGLDTVDSILNGGFAAGIHGIAGRSGIGKSSLITELETQAASQEKRVLSLSYELSKEQKWSRIASRYSEYSWSDIEKDRSILEPDVANQIEEISKLVRIELGWNIDQILAAIDNFDVVVVDYIQRMEFEGNDTRKGIDLNMGKLSNVARDKNKTIFIISSMAEGTENFKESGSILYMCQSGWFLKKVQSNVCDMHCIKNTRGKADEHVFIEMNFPHQRVKEIPVNLDWIK